jgi:hypothetical protein
VRILLCCIAAAFLLSGCGGGEVKCLGQPGDFMPDAKCSPVQVDYSVDAREAVQARIEGVLRKDDGIAVDVSEGTISPGNITIICKAGDPSGVFIVSQDHWLSQDAADVMVADAEKREPDHVNRVMLLIHMIHDYQDTHPRIVTVTPTAAPRPVQSHGILGWLVIVFRILISLAAGALLIVLSGPAWRLLCRVVWWTWRIVFYLVTRPSIWAARRRGRRNALAQRAIEQNRLVESNDSRGIYGNYPPAEVE